MKKKLWVIAAFLLCAALIGCGGASVNDQTNPDKQQVATISAQEQVVFDQINQYRATKNLKPLKINDSLTEQARNHSNDMALGRVSFGHDGFEDRIKASGLQGPAAENVAYNVGYSDPATVAVEGWLQSDGHRHNIEGDYNLTGIGVVQNSSGEYYFTQIFMLVTP